MAETKKTYTLEVLVFLCLFLSLFCCPQTPQLVDNSGLQEVAKHNKDDDMWMVVHGKVYDVTKFKEDHPGIQSFHIGARYPANPSLLPAFDE